MTSPGIPFIGVAARRLRHLRGLRGLMVVTLLAGLAACSSTPDKPKPAELPPAVALVGARLAWTAQVGQIGFPMDMMVNGDRLSVASSDGTVAVIDARNGRDLWRASVGAALSAGVGSDGRVVAVITRTNDVVALDGGKEVWRQRLGAQSYTSPFVAGGRVFVLGADRTVTAFDARDGRKLWAQSRQGEPLVLQQGGVLLAVGDTLLVGLSGRLVAFNPINGSIRWEAPIAVARGTNDIERLVDLVGRVSRRGDVVCARAFQASVGCVNAARGNVVWSRPASGVVGVHGDERMVFGTEADGKVIAWDRVSGERLWSSERLMHRGLTAPLSVGRSVAVGDATGLLHLVSRDDGSLLARLATDGSAVVAAPVLAGDTLVVATRAGGVFGYLPQ